MQANQPGILEALLPFVFIFAIFYFLIIRPQSKKMKAQEKFLSELKRGDAVVTTGGLLGNIEAISEKVVHLDLGDGTKIKMLRKQIAGTQANFDIKL
jgi:preprotein translocase subunit YajC